MSGYNGSGAPASVARPMQSTAGPMFMPRPVQGYQAPMRTVDYRYKLQYQAPRQIQSPQWAVPYIPQPWELPGYEANPNAPGASGAPDSYNAAAYQLDIGD